jgi:formiminotetrahydrofolate cyclodeaminase
VEEGGDESRDFQLGLKLDRASALPIEIAEACADVAALAGELARTAEPDAQPDAAVAAILAAAAAHAAVRLVEVNLAIGADDPRAARARAAASAAADAAQFVPGAPGT